MTNFSLPLLLRASRYGYSVLRTPYSLQQPRVVFSAVTRPSFDGRSPFFKMQRDPKRPWTAKAGKHKRRKKESTRTQGSKDEVLLRDVKSLLSRHTPVDDGADTEDNGTEVTSTVVHEFGGKEFPETEVTVTDLSSTGDGLALSPARDHVYTIPFTVPGDVARVKVCKTMADEQYSVADLVRVLTPSPQRDDSLINCKYFGACSGCQLQMISYQDQLRHKKRVVEKAYQNISGLLPEMVPAIGDTMGSPLQYGYRTKLTPHFDTPRRQPQNDSTDTPTGPEIGFMRKNRRHVMDIEDCPLGTDMVRRGLSRERWRVLENLDQYKRGATILLRETTQRTPKSVSANSDVTTQKPQEQNAEAPQNSQTTPGNSSRSEFPDYTEKKNYVTHNSATSCEYVDDHVFYTKANAFFQNNNSILSPFIAYVRDRVRQPAVTESSGASTSATSSPLPPPTAQNAMKPNIKYLLDAYCGSGLFTITLSEFFRSSLGIDSSSEGIQSARDNSDANSVPNANFSAADAAHLFRDVPYPPDQTLLIIDPPRKGCDENFLNQMLTYGPARVIYVSCNVHTQARDVEAMVNGGQGSKYGIESIKGFDFFPQTGHVESVAVLNKVE